ncbi:hypothetical protein SKAU_G00029080 [Synaphobranchus kaupii]|uniref:C1q domain-containing protein n=1 Tax=Synaphobranchus kaupii TaxID=118154 RepID=A0A9Q1GDE7_SYNKA|nr:hypothetical protein SKAU_G00029080 [Synaphobranchus kaupii]
MFSRIKESIGVYLDAPQSSTDRTSVVQYPDSETEVKTSVEVKTSPEESISKTSVEVRTSAEVRTSHEIEVSPSDVYISTDGSIPKGQSDARVQSSAPQICIKIDPMYKVTTVLFGTLWVVSMISLVAGIVLYYEQTSFLKNEMDHLRLNITHLTGLEKTKVAFAASLRKLMQVTVGPYREFRILVYKNVFTNIGNAYNDTTGMFTAPVKGVYQFSFTAFGWSTDIPTAADLYKNGVYITGAYDNNPGPGRGTAISVALEMDVGDIVYLGLNKGMRVHDNTNHYNVFSGHLLFPLLE